MTTFTPPHDHPLVLGPALRRYLAQHVDRVPSRGGFAVVTKPLHVFKKVEIHDKHGWPSAIASLVIPAGAGIYMDASAFSAKHHMNRWGSGPRSERKMRASFAKVHSLAAADTGKPRRTATSEHDPGFKYRPGRLVTPTEPFSRARESCASGIHFFLNLADAANY